MTIRATQAQARCREDTSKRCTATSVRISHEDDRLDSPLLTLGLLAAFFASTQAAAEQSPAALRAQAKVTEAKARRTALAKVPGGSIKSAELEKERGRLIWSFDVVMSKSRDITEVQVDAKTGKIVSTQIETPADQAKEATADQKIEKVSPDDEEMILGMNVALPVRTAQASR